jgi:hypothetical protein
MDEIKVEAPKPLTYLDYKVNNGKPNRIELYDETAILKNSQSTGLEYDKLFETKPQQGGIICFVCRRGAYTFGGVDAKIDIGLPVCLFPTQPLESERLRQSEIDKKMNEKKDALEVISKQEKKNYCPFKPCSKPSDYVKPHNPTDKIRLRAKMLPGGVFLCRECRCRAESGDDPERSDGLKIVNNGKEIRVFVPPINKRNGINKFQQIGYRILQYVDAEGKKHDITDRFSIITDPTSTTTIKNLLQQISLFMGYSVNEIHKHSDKVGDRDEKSYTWPKEEQDVFYKKLGTCITKVCSMLMRSCVESMMKTDGQVEIQEFTDSFYNFIMILRSTLALFIRYPLVKDIIAQKVILWSTNPFNANNRNQFDFFMDPIFAAALTGLPYTTIHRAIVLCLFNILTQNFKVEEKNMVKKDDVTYLRQLFNEGRNTKIIRSLLYCQSFANLIYTIGTQDTKLDPSIAISKLIDNYGGYIPWSDCLTVWKDMKHCVKNIVSIEPKMIEENKQPVRTIGLWLHLGMETNLNQDNIQIRKNIINAITYVNKNLDKWREQIIPPTILENIEKFNLQLMKVKRVTVVRREEELKKANDKRLEEAKKIHSGYPIPLPRSGRPCLQCLECRFPRCGRKFESTGALYRHLKDVLPDLRDNLHIEHERYVNDLNFTPEKVLENSKNSLLASPKDSVLENSKNSLLASPLDSVLDMKLTECPVACCDQKGRKFTPQELVDHFISLGISPFWVEGIELPKYTHEFQKGLEEVKEEAKVEPIKQFNLWENPGVCSICMDSECDIIILQCGHICTCNGCLIDWMKTNKDEDDDSTCPACRNKINATIKFADAKKLEMQDKVYFIQADL